MAGRGERTQRRVFGAHPNNPDVPRRDGAPVMNGDREYEFPPGDLYPMHHAIYPLIPGMHQYLLNLGEDQYPVNLEDDQEQGDAEQVAENAVGPPDEHPPRPAQPEPEQPAHLVAMLELHPDTAQFNDETVGAGSRSFYDSAGNLLTNNDDDNDYVRLGFPDLNMMHRFENPLSRVAGRGAPGGSYLGPTGGSHPDSRHFASEPLLLARDLRRLSVSDHRWPTAPLPPPARSHAPVDGPFVRYWPRGDPNFATGPLIGRRGPSQHQAAIAIAAAARIPVPGSGFVVGPYMRYPHLNHPALYAHRRQQQQQQQVQQAREPHPQNQQEQEQQQPPVRQAQRQPHPPPGELNQLQPRPRQRSPSPPPDQPEEQINEQFQLEPFDSRPLRQNPNRGRRN